MTPAPNRYLHAMGQAVMDLGADAVFLVDRETLHLLEANRAFHRLLGWSAEEIPQLSLEGLLEARPELGELLASIDERQGQAGVHRFRRKEGGVLEMEVSAGTSSEGGRPLLLVVARDLTERRAAEARQRESEERLRVAFQTVPDALTISRVDDNTYVEVNEGFTKVSGWSAEEGLGKTALDLDLWAEPKDREVVQARLKADGFLREVEGRFKRKDGTPFHGAVSGRFMTVNGTRYYLSVTRDITERKLAEAERERLEGALRQSDKLSAIGQLAGGVAHDFNNQLTAVVGAAEELVDALPNPQHRDMARDILIAATRSAELTRKLLAFARRGQAQRAPVDVHQLVRETCSVLRRSIDRRIYVETKLGAAHALVLGDAAELQNALLNLALNARDAMPEGGKISIETQTAWVSDDDAAVVHGIPPGRYLQLAVSDSGCGMSKEVQARLFEPFFTTKPSGQGTGMGLASLYGTVRAHGGCVSVYSEPGKGSTFRLHLPLSVEAQQRRVSSLEGLPVVTGLHVLVVDDEILVREQFGRALRALGHQVDQVESGEQALRWLRGSSRRPDVIILDVVMPGLGGRDTFAALKAADPKVRVIVTSGFALDGEIQGMIDDGALAFLQKPFLRSALVRALLTAMGEGEAQPRG
jgi:two-component system, cell cycle sensor histidine kinase and response regulator CckA